MPVYVDNMMQPYGRMLMSHMFCDPIDTVDELHQMADALKLKRKWFQDKKAEFPHYDISKAYREKAIKLGAIPVTCREMVRMIQERRPAADDE